MLQNLSIVIPTLNRQSLALRNARFWSNLGPKVYVLDGSVEAINHSLLKTLGSNIEYKHWPVSYLERISRVTELIHTPYTILMCDDEFYLPSALERSIEFLNLEKDYVACTGKCIVFDWKDRLISSGERYKTDRSSISHNSPFDRCLYHVKEYIPRHIYAVIRTDVWIKAWGSTFVKEYLARGQFEIQFELSVAYLGKTKILPVLSWLRSWEVDPVPSTSTDISTNINNRPFGIWWLDKKKNYEHHEMISIMSKVLGGGPNLMRTLDAAFTIYSGKVYGIYPNIKSKIAHFLEKYSPKFLKIIIKYKGGLNTVWFDFNQVCKDLESEEVEVNFDDIKLIQKTISDFYTNK